MAHDPFALFCEYYLGLTPEGTYRFANANKMAKRLNVTPGDLLNLLRKHRMHPDAVLNTDFPMARYQVDIQIAADEHPPDELLRRARAIYEAFLGSAGRPRDWAGEIEAEKKADRERGRF